jgi:hypothetical protein
VTVAAMAAGEITPDEALTVTKVLDRKRRALEARARRQAVRETVAGETAAVLAVAPASEDTGADLHSACINRSDDSDTPAADAAVPAVATAESDLHSACIFRPNGGEMPVAGIVAEPVATPPAPPRPPFPTFGSACIRPALRGRPTRAPAVPIAGVAAMLRSHPKRTSRP